MCVGVGGWARVCSCGDVCGNMCGRVRECVCAIACVNKYVYARAANVDAWMSTCVSRLRLWVSVCVCVCVHECVH